ncbi:MAG: hypothetical protein WCG67_01850 [Ferruginibacter sp.]
MQKRRHPFLSLLMLFLFLNALFFIMPSFFERYGIERRVLVAANALFFLANLIVFLLQRKALKNTNPNVFIRSVMAGTMIKMVIIAGAFIGYVVWVGKSINKPAIYISMFLYFLYLAVEVAIVMNLNKQNNA